MKLKSIILLISISTLLASCQQTPASDSSESKKGTIKVTLLYPNDEGSTFDMDYYANNHMPMVARLLGESMKGFKIDKGIAGRTPDELVPYLAIGYLYFEKLSDYESSFGPNAEQIIGDIPNYTNVQPILQISEVIE